MAALHRVGFYSRFLTVKGQVFFSLATVAKCWIMRQMLIDYEEYELDLLQLESAMR